MFPICWAGQQVACCDIRENTIHYTNVDLMLCHRLQAGTTINRHWFNVSRLLGSLTTGGMLRYHRKHDTINHVCFHVGPASATITGDEQCHGFSTGQ